MNCNPLLFLVIEDHPEVNQNNCEFLRMIDYEREDLKALRIRWVDITPPEYIDLETYSCLQQRSKLS